MSSQQIFVALLSICLVSQQVAAVVNNSQSKNSEESNKKSAEPTENNTSNKENDLVAESSDDKSNRREASLNLGDTYGPPAVPSAPGNLNFPVPVYGVPDAPSNNVVYPAPPPDIPPPLTQSGSLYGAPLSSLYGIPSNTYGIPSNLYGVPPVKLNVPSISTNYGIPPIKYEVPNKFFPGPNRGPKPIYGPPRFQYGPPGKPLLGGTKFHKGFPSKQFVGGYRPSKPFSTYGAPTFYKDNFSASKLNLNSFSGNTNFLTNSASLGSFSNLYSGGAHLSTQYGVPLKQPIFDIAPSTQYAVPPSPQYGPPSPQYGPPSPQYGAPQQSISDQYGAPDVGIIGPPAITYGPPQPSPNPKPPHPGAPAPPTPPDIKYDGWQPIPGLTSKPNPNYGAPSTEYHAEVNFGNDLVPPPPLHGGGGDQNGGGGLDTYALPPLEANHIDLGPRQPLSDSYGAPLNTVTGSGGIVASSGEEVHGQHQGDSQLHNNIGLGLSAIGVNQQGSDIQAVKSVEYEIFSNGGSGYKVSDSYGAPPLNSFAADGPYAAAHSYNSLGSSNLGAFNVHTHHNSHNIHNNKYQGLSLSSSGIGLIPPSGVYGVQSSGHHGTPLYSNSFNFNPPKRPIFHKEPLPSGLFQNIAKQSAYRVGHGIHSSSQLSPGPVYLPPSTSDLPRPVKDFAGPELSNLYSLPHTNTPTSFQSIAHGNSLQGFDLVNQSPVLTSYNVPLNTVDGSYGLPSTTGTANVGIDFSHPPVSIDLTGNSKQNSFASTDCLHKSNTVSLPSTSYGAPTAVDGHSSDFSNIQLTAPQTSYGEPNLPALPVPQAQYGPPDLIHSSSIKSESTVNSIQAQSETNGKSYGNLIANSIQAQTETHGKSYGKSVAESFGPNSELIESQSLDLNHIPLQGALGTYTLQIQSADGKNGHVPHSQVLNEGLLQSILAAIEKPNSSIIQLQPSVEQSSYSTNDTKIVFKELGNIHSDGHTASSNVNEVIAEVPNGNDQHGKDLQLIDDNGIALYFSNISNKQDNLESDSETTTTEISTVQNS